MEPGRAGREKRAERGVPEGDQVSVCELILTGSTGPVASKMGAVERELAGKGKMGRGARGPPRVS